MAVVAGMTVMQLVELIAALESGTLSLIKIHDELKAEGKQDNEPVPSQHGPAVASALAVISRGLPQLSSDAFIDRLRN